MDRFSGRDAWAKGVAFLSGKAAGHAILLIGIGIVAPIGLQYLAAGRVSGLISRAMVPGSEVDRFADGGGVAIAGYLLQLVSFFASWRLGLEEREATGGAAVFGLLAGLVAAVGAFGVLVVFGVAGALLFPPGLVIVVAIVMMVLYALFCPFLAALLAAGAAMLMALSLILGAVTGTGFAPAALGGSGFTGALFILAAGLLLWLTVRFGCVTCLMADRKRLNPFALLAESWRLTGAEQMRVMRYLALVSLGAALAFLLIAAAARVSLEAGLGDAAAIRSGVVAIVLEALVGIPLAFLAVMMPAGIYRELARSAGPAEIFA